MAGRKDGDERRDREKHYRRAALTHPLRRAILRLLLGGTELGVDEIGAELEEASGRTGYHLRVLFRRKAVKATATGRRARPLYGFAPRARWVRKMLAEFDAGEEEGDRGGRD
jgi:DNA-binding transcriptional ArsR family regulator